MHTLQLSPSASLGFDDWSGLEALEERQMIELIGGAALLAAGCLIGLSIGFVFVVALVAGVVWYAYTH
jgi:hypothetical protein